MRQAVRHPGRRRPRSRRRDAGLGRSGTGRSPRVRGEDEVRRRTRSRSVRGPTRSPRSSRPTAGLRRCFKVRWALVISTDGVSLDQVRVNRVENGQTFRVRGQLRRRLRPDHRRPARSRPALPRPDGQRHSGRLFTGPDNGWVTFAAQALDAAGRELAAADRRAGWSPRWPPSRRRRPRVGLGGRGGDRGQPGADRGAGTPGRRESTSTRRRWPRTRAAPSVLGPGLIIGAVLVFLGVALLLRLRTRNRRKGHPAWQPETQTLPTGFYTMPRQGE